MSSARISLHLGQYYSSPSTFSCALIRKLNWVSGLLNADDMYARPGRFWTQGYRSQCSSKWTNIIAEGSWLALAIIIDSRSLRWSDMKSTLEVWWVLVAVLLLRLLVRALYFHTLPDFPARTSKLLATKMKWNGSDDDRIRGKKGNRSIIVLFFFVPYF